jgi:hypothetical protein
MRMSQILPLVFAQWPWLVPVLLLAGTITIRRRGAAFVQWLEEKAQAHAVAHMPPSNTARFRRRIARRVAWLRFKDWWSRPKLGMVREHWRRPTLILLTGAAVIGMVLFAFPVQTDGFFAQLKGLFAEDKKMDWRAASQLLIVLLGLPIGFMLWLFRDIHVNAVLENQRKDVNLKEFQEIQLRAAGAMDEKLPKGARESLQIAATHQLAGFLRGGFGKSFQRPAWELLRAQLLASAQMSGYQSIPEQIEAWHKADPDERVTAAPLGRSVRDAIRSIKMDSIGKAQRAAVRDEWRTIFGGKLPLSDTVFDGINAPEKALLASCALERCSFIGANLPRAHLEGANLRFAHLEGANLQFAHLEGADLQFAHLEGADLTRAHLEGAILGEAHLEGANLGGAHLEGAILWDAHLDDNTRLFDAAFNDATQFAMNWDQLSPEQKAKARAPWIARGMKHVDQLAKERKERKEREDQARLAAAAKPAA